MKKHFIVLIYILLFIFPACNTSNQLHYKYRRYFSEENVIRIKPPFTLSQDIGFNIPLMTDEEYYHKLNFKFLDTIAAKTKRILNLETDTAIVKAQYTEPSYWARRGGDEVFQVSGRIKILVWNRSRIKIKERVLVVNAKGDKHSRFYGVRTFRLEKPERTDWIDNRAPHNRRTNNP